MNSEFWIIARRSFLWAALALFIVATAKGRALWAAAVVGLLVLWGGYELLKRIQAGTNVQFQKAEDAWWWTRLVKSWNTFWTALLSGNMTEAWWAKDQIDKLASESDDDEGTTIDFQIKLSTDIVQLISPLVGLLAGLILWFVL